MKARDLETRIKNLESAIMDMQKLLQVINERISHNGRGIDLLIDLDSDTDNDTVSEDIKPLTLEDYLDTIRNADDNEGNDYVELYYIISIPNTPNTCLLYTSPSPRDRTRSRMPSSA